MTLVPEAFATVDVGGWLRLKQQHAHVSFPTTRCSRPPHPLTEPLLTNMRQEPRNACKTHWYVSISLSSLLSSLMNIDFSISQMSSWLGCCP